MALRDRAIELDLSASSIAGIAARIRREISSANTVFNNSGITNAVSWNARFERINLESNLSKALETVRNSDRLFHADRIMRANHGRFQTADQVDLYERRMQEITHPIAAKRRLYRETYGNGAGIDLLNAEYRQAYDDAMLELTDPRQARLNKLTEQFGNSARARSYLNRESAESFRLAMEDKDEQFIQGAMREKGWTRSQAEQVYFKNLTENTKWLRLIARNNPTIAKNLIPIAKTIGKASGLPIIGAFAANPALAAITAAIGGFASTMISSNAANEATKKWRNYENLYGKPTTQQEWNARLAGIKDPSQIAKIYGELAAKFGGDPEMFLLSQGIALRGMTGVQKQYHAAAFGLTPEMVRLAEIYAGATPEESDIVDARRYALEREESEGWKSGSGFRKTLRSMQLKWSPFQKDIEARGWSWSKILALANPLQFGGQFIGNEIGNAVWDEVHDTAEIDDRYRAGMYDNSVTNNDASRSVNLQVNVASPQITTTGDPVDFAKGIANIGSRALSEYQSVIENTDTKRTR